MVVGDAGKVGLEGDSGEWSEPIGRTPLAADRTGVSV
jgi:hypothetical protein